MCSGQRRWRNTSFNACRICGASSGGANGGGHRDRTCRVSDACISWARSAGTIGGARRASSSQVRSIAVCIVPVPVVSEAPVQAVRTAPAPVVEYIVLVSAVSVAPAPAVDAVPLTLVWRTSMMPHALAALTMKPVVTAANDVSKSSWRCCCRSSDTRRRLAGEAHRDVRASLNEVSAPGALVMFSPQTVVFCPEDVLWSVHLAISVSKFGGAWTVRRISCGRVQRRPR